MLFSGNASTKTILEYKFVNCCFVWIIRSCLGEFGMCNLIFLIRFVGDGVQTGSTRHVGYLLAYCQPRMIVRMENLVE
jgi:hypothetical protein